MTVAGLAHGDGARLLVTGGAGFIGSCFVRDALADDPTLKVTVLDLLTYAGRRDNLAEIDVDPARASRLTFVRGDIADARLVGEMAREADAIVNFAAESHVDRSIDDAAAFLHTGVTGVHVLLEAVLLEAGRAAGGERAAAPRFLQVSTDEVYGSVETGFATERDPIAPRSPYAAAKAAGELLALSYHTTHGLDVVVTRGSNTYGPYQYPEKLIPLFVTNAIQDRPLPLYGDGRQERDWLHVSDHAGAILHVLREGRSGTAYNVPGAGGHENREIVQILLERLGKPWSLVRSIEDRPGHDRRYAMNGARLASIGWQNRVGFEAGMAATVDWYREHADWWRTARSGDWDEYYERLYGERLASSTAADG
jgi:dTDP-glucose 4,6-dehydratase